MAVYDVVQFREPGKIRSYLDAFLATPEVFLGVSSPPAYPKWYLAIVTLMRLVLVGFLLAIIIKRFNRR